MMSSHLAANLAGALAFVSSLFHPSHVASVLFATAPAVIPAGGGAGDGDDEGDGDAEVIPSIADVGREILSGLSDEEKKRQLADPDLDDDEDAAGAGDAADDDDAGTDDDDAGTDDDDVIDDDTDLEGRADVDAAKAAANDKAKPGAKPKEGEASEAIKVVLPGLAARGEEDIEIEIDDKDIADRLRRLKNDSVKAREYATRLPQIEAREGELAAVTDAIEADPVAFTLEKMSPERQLEVARALILEHLDVLTPEIDELINDPQKRADKRIELRDALKKSGENLTLAREVKAHAQKCVRAFEALVPEGTDEDTAAEFASDARQLLAAAAKRGEKVTPETVPTILARRVKLYGFDKKPAKPVKSAAAGKPGAAAAQSRTARPLTDKAREIADRRAATAAAASGSQSRIRRTQVARQAGSKVAPAGAGAAPVQLPAVPPEAEQDIASMSKHLRGGKLPETWGATAE